MSMKIPDIKIVIPARLSSTRLSEKVLAEIAGKTMLEWVWLRAMESDLGEVIIAVDNERVKDCASAFGAHVVMTEQDHQSGTDRCAEVAAKMDWHDDTRIINLQSDEPQMPSVCLQHLAALSMSYDLSICSLYSEIHDDQEFHDPSVVKVLSDDEGKALYFSRAPVPYRRDEEEPWPVGVRKRHIGLYAYPKHILRCITQLAPSPYERLEKLEQLRFLEAGLEIQLAAASVSIPAGIDTQEDLHRVRNNWQ